VADWRREAKATHLARKLTADRNEWGGHQRGRHCTARPRLLRLADQLEPLRYAASVLGRARLQKFVAIACRPFPRLAACG
jgi:hypothetical protein